eukprot:4268393-Prorocentrum_lima.AAC.1
MPGVQPDFGTPSGSNIHRSTPGLTPMMSIHGGSPGDSTGWNFLTDHFLWEMDQTVSWNP